MEPFAESFRKDHLLSRVDARIKLLVTLFLLVMVLSHRGFAFPWLIVAGGFFTVLHMKIPLRVFLLRFSEPILIGSVILILKGFFSGQDPFFSIELFGFTLTGYRDGLIEGLRIVSRVLAAVSLVGFVGFSTSFTDLLSGLSWLRVPRGLIEIGLFAYRYLFVLLDDAVVIYHAQKNRLGYAKFGLGIRSSMILSGALILKAFERSDCIASSMRQRGFDGHIPMIKTRPFKPSEVMASALLIAVFGTVWAIG